MMMNKIVKIVLLALLPALPLMGLKAAERPNVLLIFADDMGYGEIQRFHPEASKVPTPHLNKLCDEGMMFTDAHTSASVCTPSRYSLLTGRYNWRSKHQKGVLVGGKPCLIAPDRMTLASLFKQQGYRTAMFGKWHLDFQYQRPEGKKPKKYVRDSWNYGEPIGTKIPDGPITRGFDQFLGFHHSRTMSSIIKDDQVIEYVECVNTMHYLTDAAVDYISNHAKGSDESPFFLYYPLNSPHAPVVPAKDWQGRGGIDGAYPEFVAQTDDAVGQVLTALEQHGIKENTIVLFATDNGCHQSPNLYLDRGHSVSGPLRNKKGSIYEGGHRIPFIVRWPNVTPAGKTDRLVCMTDLFATFAEYFSFDIEADTAEDSISFLSVLKGKEDTGIVKREDIVHHDALGRFAIRQGDWKLIFRKDDLVKETSELESKYQLYNLADDLAETTNLANQNPDKVKALAALLEKQIANGRTTPGEPQKNDARVEVHKGKKRNR